MPSQFDPQFEKRRKAEREKEAAEKQAAEKDALKNEAPPAPATDANAEDAKTVTPADGNGKETQPAPDAKATATTEPVTEPPTKDAAAPAKDAAVSADAPAAKKEGAAPAKSPAQPAPTAPPAPAAVPKDKPLADSKNGKEKKSQPLTPEEERKEEDKHNKRLRQRNQLTLNRAVLNPDALPLSVFAGIPNPEEERKKMIVDMYLHFHDDGTPLSGGDEARKLRIKHMAMRRFNGRGMDSEEEFFAEMQKEAQVEEEAQQFSFQLLGQLNRSRLNSPYTWQQFFETAKKHPKYKPQYEGSLFRLWDAGAGVPEDIASVAKFSTVNTADGVVPAPLSETKIRDLAELIPIRQRAQRIFGPGVREKGQESIAGLVRLAQDAATFIPRSKADEFINYFKDERSPEERQAMYESARESAAAEFGISTKDLDDVVKHHLGAQEKAVSRDALGQVHIKDELFFKGLPELERAIRQSDITETEKEEQLADLPERFRQFQEMIVASTIKDMPEFAKEFGIRSVEDFHKITEALNTESFLQVAGGGSVAAGKMFSSVEYGLGLFEEKIRLGGVFGESYLKERSEEVDRLVKIEQAVNQLSYLFHRDKVSVFGIDGAIVGEGLYSIVESAAIVVATGPLAPEITTARYLPFVQRINSALKVVPAATIFSMRRGFSTYEEALRKNMKEPEAIRLGVVSGMIEGVTTVVFSGIGAGGMEDVVSGAARESLRASLRTTLKSAWQESAKNFGKNMLGELTEEQLITLMDTAFVQLKLHPNMTAEEIKKAFYTSAVITVLGSSSFSAFHGKQAYDITSEYNRIAREQQAGTSPVLQPSGGITTDANAATPAPGTLEEGAPARTTSDIASFPPAETQPARLAPLPGEAGITSTLIEFPEIDRMPRASYTPGSGFTLHDLSTGREIGRAATAEEATRIAAERADLTLEDDAAAIANITAAYQRAENAGTQKTREHSETPPLQLPSKEGGGYDDIGTQKNGPVTDDANSPDVSDSEKFPGATISGDESLFKFGYSPNPSQPPPSLTAYLDGSGILFYGIQTPSENSPVRGREMFDRMITHYGDRIKGIQGEWYSDNISKENPRSNLYTANNLTATGVPLEEAAMLTFTGKMASKHGFTVAKVVEAKGTPGKYTTIKIIFQRP